MSICNNILYLKVLSVCMLAIKLITFIIPIILIIKIALDLYKNMININDKSDLKNLITRRLTATVIIFLIPTFIRLIMKFVEITTDNKLDYESCVSNIKNIKELEELEKETKRLEEELKREELLAKAEEYRANQNEKIKQNLANMAANSNSTGGVTIGQKYDLTESQLSDIAKICQNEQSSAVGAAAEASLMANRYELYGSKYSSLYDYVLNCNWWHPAKTGSYKNTNLKNDVLNAVREVLIMGNRTLDLFVDEHDCIDCGSYGFDIIKLDNNGKIIEDKTELKDHNNYIKDVTIIYNRYGSQYTFSVFPTKSSDPFGYTKRAKEKIDSLNS